MGKFNFDEIVNRSGSGCVKWDHKAPFGADMKDVIPMWVADMDFKAAPFILDALRKRMDHGVFGYVHVPDSYYDSVTGWFSKRYGWNIDKNQIIYTTGVVPAMSAVIKALTKPGDKVLLQTPVYNCFFSSIRNNGCELSDNPLIFDGNTCTIDFDDFEEKCKEARLLMFCNPHNPAGRVWTREELIKVGEIARKHGVIVVSDEIHCELVMPGHKFIPFASVSPENEACCVTMNSPSKNFNIAGLHIANIITSNPEWRAAIDKAININEICDVNPFGVVALEAAYSPEGEQWLDELNAYVYENYRILKDAFEKDLPRLAVADLEGTYLAWVDCRTLGLTSEKIEEELLKNEKVWVNAGAMYGLDGFIRINLATPHALATEGISRIVRGLKRLTD